MHPVIGVHAGNELATGSLDTMIECCNHTLAWVTQQLDAGVFAGGRIYYCSGVIRGSIVDGQEFKISQRLLADRLQGFFEGGYCVVIGQYDTQQGRVPVTQSSRPSTE